MTTGLTRTDEMYGRFERDGETAVRDSLAGGAYLDDDAALATEWLRRRDQGRVEASERERLAASREQMRIALSAKNAAWIAATAATIAAIISTVSIVVMIKSLLK